MMPDPSLFPPFKAPFAPDDGVIAARLLAAATLSAERNIRIDRTATRLIAAIRSGEDRLGGVEDMLREFALSTKEGLALMVLAEALLRVPDARTADQFIEDKLGQGARHVGARHSARRDPRRHHRPARQAARRSRGACRHPAGDAADGQPFRS